MPARVVVVHDDPDFGMAIAVALKVAGYDVAMLPDSMIALGALEAASRIEMLITGINFPAGRPNGIALARMTRPKRPGIRVLFTARPEFASLVDGLGEFLATPVLVDDVVQAVRHALPLSPRYLKLMHYPQRVAGAISTLLCHNGRHGSPNLQVGPAARSLLQRQPENG